MLWWQIGMYWLDGVRGACTGEQETAMLHERFVMMYRCGCGSASETGSDMNVAGCNPQ